MSNRTEYLLTQLRCASLRARLVENELHSIGVALKAGWIDDQAAMEWCDQIGAIGLLGTSADALQRKAVAA